MEKSSMETLTLPWFWNNEYGGMGRVLPVPASDVRIYDPLGGVDTGCKVNFFFF